MLDGSNIAWEEKNDSNKPQINNIESMINRLSRANFKKIITVADAALRYQIDEQKRLDRLVREGAMKMLPARVDGDKFILRIAEEENAMIVSNDMFKEFRESTPWIDERRIPYTILDGEVYLHPTSVLPSVEIGSKENKERKENDNTFET
ncbi:MAG: NYN domain-containing protein [Candidatus Heimdallarchaeaceae archaeon]